MVVAVSVVRSGRAPHARRARPCGGLVQRVDEFACARGCLPVYLDPHPIIVAGYARGRTRSSGCGRAVRADQGIGGTACSSPWKSTEEYSRSLVKRW